MQSNTSDNFLSNAKSDFTRINLKSFFSLNKFDSLVEGCVVAASYTIAAIFIPQIINLALGSIVGLVATAGLVAACYGAYNWYQINKNNSHSQDLDKMKNITYAGGAALVLSMTLSFSAMLLPLILTAVVGHRSFSAITAQHWSKLNDVTNSLGITNRK
jgi:hypothetical protein